MVPSTGTVLFLSLEPFLFFHLNHSIPPGAVRFLTFSHVLKSRPVRRISVFETCHLLAVAGSIARSIKMKSESLVSHLLNTSNGNVLLNRLQIGFIPVFNSPLS